MTRIILSAVALVALLGAAPAFADPQAVSEVQAAPATDQPADAAAPSPVPLNGVVGFGWG
jgi:hypothetical protein